VRKKTDFEKLLIRDAASNRRMRNAADTALRAWHRGVMNGDLYALRLFRKHKRDGRME
jgi:hypothetical protein